MHIQKVGDNNRSIALKEISLKRGNLNSDDVFIIDLGTTIYQWNGKNSCHGEKFNAAQYVQKLRNDRNGKAKFEIQSIYENSDSTKTV